MPEDLSFEDAQKNLRVLLGIIASKELKVLVEDKHLYQKVEIQFAETPQGLYKRVYQGQKDHFATWVNQSLSKERFELQLHLTDAERILILLKPALPLILPHLSLFCKNCGRREAFAPLRHADLIGQIRAEIVAGRSKQIAMPADFQMFSLVYQCQSCLGVPESFLVRRDGWTLSLQGRSPMEQIEVPKYLPKIEIPFYRDAVIAFNSGKTLAALFYLRTFIEQFGRRITGMTGKATGDEIFDAYYKTLDAKHADQMPSLRDWYDKLSDSVHSAREDAALFELAKAEIERHFDFRRIFGISEPKPVASPAIPAQAKASDSK
jgi:hypothetical protein